MTNPELLTVLLSLRYAAENTTPEALKALLDELIENAKKK
ncbi:hypothetical protein AGMMS49975_05720 [Clostridia bacterium]|nr:hypothetical protein AGMMS49975_05720 [Clostridia bacterium]